MARGVTKGRPPRAGIVLKPGRDKPVLSRHPWIFSGAIGAVGEDAVDGEPVDVESSSGAFLARGLLNRRSQIVVRVFTWNAGEFVDAELLRRRIRAAALARTENSGAARLVHAESDGLPGLVVDRYGEYSVLQASTLGMDRRKADVGLALLETLGLTGVWDRSDVDGRDKEGLERTTGLLAGEAPPEILEVPERTHSGGEVVLLVDLRRGHKTGAYLDQCDNRRIVGACSNGAEVLNLFSYTGAFGLHALAGGAARVTNVDSSADALALSERAAERNGAGDRVHHLRADAFEALRRFREEGCTFDGIVIDPPKLAHTSGQVERAARAYKDLARVAFRIVRPGGFVATFSCSGLVSAELFQKITWSASLEAERSVRIVKRLCQPSDHPVLLSFPEGEYLKGLLCRVD